MSAKQMKLKLRFELEVVDEGGIDLKGEIMGLSEEVRLFAGKVDTATNTIAARIQALIDKQTGISAEDKSEFERIVSSLETLGKDPNQDPTSVIS